MIAGIESNKKMNPIITELYIRGRNLNICLVFFYTILFYGSPKQTQKNQEYV